MIKNILYDLRSIDGVNIKNYTTISSKSAVIKCYNGRCYFLKKTDYFVNDKYRLLYNQGLQNVIYPKLNKKGEYVNNNNENMYYILDYHKSDVLSEEYLATRMLSDLTTLHLSTRYKKILSQKQSRRKMEDIYNYLLYKFNLLESFVRTVECSDFNENSILILKNYQYILDSKKIMARLNKKLIVDVKNGKSIYYSFVHNNPKNSHLIVSEGNSYLISFEKSRLGIPSLDIVKFYIENENLNIDIREMILNYFSNYDDDFYINYFYFFVMLYYLKGVIVINNNYVTSQSIVYCAKKLNTFITRFQLNDTSKT